MIIVWNVIYIYDTDNTIYIYDHDKYDKYMYPMDPAVPSQEVFGV
jgi:translation elongation factor P/translation initiation factor 5A